MKNGYFAALALAGLVSFAACGGEAEVGDETLVEDTAVIAPITPEPMIVDSTGALPADTLAVDTAAAM